MFGSSNVVIALWRNPRAISLTVFWSIYPIYVIATWARNRESADSFAELIFQSLVGPLVGITPLLFANIKILRGRPISSVRLTFLTYAGIAAVVAFMVRLIAAGSTLTFSNFFNGVLINGFFVIIFFSIGAYVIDSLNSISQNLQNKSLILSRLISKRDTSQEAAEDEIRILKDMLKNRVSPILQDVEYGIRSLNIEYARLEGAKLADKIQIESITPVRETSHSLIRTNGSGRSTLRTFLLAYLTRFRTILTFAKSAIFALKPPNYLASALTLLFIIVVVRGDCRPRVLLMNSILALILLLATTLGKLEFFGKPPRGALLSLGSLIIATLIWIRVYTSPVLECVENRDLSEVIFGSVVVGLTLLISGVFNQFVSETGVEEEELDTEIKLVQSDIARLENQLLQMKQKSAAVLHGPVLGRLSSIALTLRDFSARQADQSMDDLEDMKLKLLPLIASSQMELTNILDAREYLKRPVRIEIDEVVQYWQGLIKVEYRIDEFLEKINESSVPQIELSSIVQELITNANRHSDARNISIIISLVSSEEPKEKWKIAITAEDDGQKKSFIKSKGLGLSPIVEAGGTWKLTTASPRGNIIELSYPYFANYLT